MRELINMPGIMEINLQILENVWGNQKNFREALQERNMTFYRTVEKLTRIHLVEILG